MTTPDGTIDDVAAGSTHESPAGRVPAVPTPVRGMDPRISLATAVHAGPGVYALLLGSGVSSAAGTPTGWAIVGNLVSRAAAADDPAGGQQSGGALDPEVWWGERGDGSQLGYSSLLNALAPTAAGRDQLLRGYFEASDEDRQAGRKLPTAAHEAVADLVARGSVRVIVTTNFDRLLERALERRGIQPQVIHRPEQIAGMTPLTHAPVTIIKLHGDYADLDKRNTVDELSAYPGAQAALLRRVLDEYGLIVCGWSGEWDVALIQAIEETKARRYPFFWASYSAPSESAARLIAQTNAVDISGTSADDLFTGLQERLNALDRLAAPPLTRELAVARLKRYLPDPVRRIDTHDLVADELKRVEALVGDRARYPSFVEDLTNEQLDDYVRQYRADVDTLLHMLAAGAYHGGPEQVQLWTTVIRRLLALKSYPEALSQPALTNLMHYPALLAVTTMTAAGALAGRYEVVGPVLLGPRYQLGTMIAEESASHAVHPARVFNNDLANSLPRWNRAPGDPTWLHAASRLVRLELDDVLAVYEPAADRRSKAIDKAEYLISLAQIATGDQPGMGEFILRARYNDAPLPVAEETRTAILEDQSTLLTDLFDGDVARAAAALDRLNAEIVQAAGRFF
jgi:hypothetical protein